MNEIERYSTIEKSKIVTVFFRIVIALNAVALLLLIYGSPEFMDTLGTLVMNNQDGIKNVAMTIGLTGAIFGWLTPILINQECGVSVDCLFKFKFPAFFWSLIVFYTDLSVVIFICSENESVLDLCIYSMVLLLSMATFISLCIMFYLCSVFLFSSQKRRACALEYLLSKIEKKKNESQSELSAIDNLGECWNFVNEIPKLLIEVERDKLECFFSLISPDRYEDEPITTRYFERLWAISSTEKDLYSMQNVILYFPPDIKKKARMVCCFFRSQIKKQEKEHTPPEDRVLFFARYLVEAFDRKSEIPSENLALFFAFCTMYCESLAPEEILKIMKSLYSVHQFPSFQ